MLGSKNRYITYISTVYVYVCLEGRHISWHLAECSLALLLF